MPDDQFYQPSDIDVLRMENELLTYENAFLKRRLAELDREGPQRAARSRALARQALAPAWRRVTQGPVGPVAVRLRHSRVGRKLESRLLPS